MKKIFILTGEPSGDKLASKVISKLQKNNLNIQYSCVGGTHLNSLGIKSIFDLKEITYIGFTSVLLNIFKIKNKINKTVEEIIKFNPDILFSVDSPDFTLRVAEKVKKIIAEHLGIDDMGKITEDAKFIDDLGADSLDTVELVMAFEEAFDVEIPDEKAETILTVGDAISHLESN